ncbi:hypothetical protein OM076_33985 [Solirubrobacter ginsenosidimutans]|uniref:Uncharacterized protein n=1 Tax=Solirubrobacter ginsenosidimutans TaxID=490573 RepID=A0A9X3S454_9ACTN|nr:hypothetical protein [Solirubrobacter ginsenosidimutans]MDA0165329.1 hypothetical protein [Solirubrobacter ginsenosidimutans]
MSDADVRRVHAAVRALRDRLDELDTVEIAVAEYDAALADIEYRRVALQERRQELRTRLSAERLPRAGAGGPRPRGRRGRDGIGKPAPVARQNRRPTGDAAIRRRRTKTLINRFAHAWEIDDERLAEINRLADDRSRPLGEMLALLDWDAIDRPLPGGESESAHTRRVSEWREALEEAQGRLSSDVRSRERQFHKVLALWERWRARDGWQEFLTDARTAKHDEVDELNREIASLEQRLREVPR